jgi:GTP-binding protein HflX
LPTHVPRERAYLVAVAHRRSGRWSAQSSLEELEELAATAGAEVVGKTVQRLPVPEKTTYIGRGKLDEIAALKSSLGYNVVIFDDELSPLQQRNLEEALAVKIIDRAALILDIFARTARTREGRIQVALAQHQYLLPRLAGQWQHLERLGGGIGTRGPGESQLETDRRLIKTRIARLEKELEQVRKHRRLYREHRKKSLVPVIALVGYTNVGKSTLLNTLTGAGVGVADKLFSTLDPITRRIRIPDGRDVLVTDTVGFIRKLPPTLVAAFRATLEELDEADLLLHMVDISTPNAALQSQTVEEILKEMNLAKKPRITVVNKIDRLLDSGKTWGEKSALEYLKSQVIGVAENTVLISAAKAWGLNDLLAMIAKVLPPPIAVVQGHDAL